MMHFPMRDRYRWRKGVLGTSLVCWAQSLHQRCWQLQDLAVPPLLRHNCLQLHMSMAGIWQGAGKPVRSQSAHKAA